MKVSDIELVIFDVDGTLYQLGDVMESVYRNQVNFFSEKFTMPKHEVERFFAANHVYPYVATNSKSATELFFRMGINKEDWNRYREEHFVVSSIQKRNAVKEETIRLLSSGRKAVLLSSNTLATIDKILLHIGISISCFDEVICSDKFPSQEPFSKKVAIEYFSRKYGLKYVSMLLIGDRFQTDIKPVLELGGMGILIESPQSLVRLSNDMALDEIQSCKEYEFFMALDRK